MSCKFCDKADFGNFAVRIDGHSTGIELAGGSYRFPKDKQFKLCPECGKSLTETIINIQDMTAQELEIYCDLLPIAYKIYKNKTGLVCGTDVEKLRDEIYAKIK